MTDAELHAAVRNAMLALDAMVEANIRRELAAPIDLGHSGRLQFETCPHFFGIHLVQTEEVILPDFAIDDSLPAQLRDDAVAAGLEIFAAIHEELPSWFASRWQAVDGPEQYRPAYLLFHGGLDEPRFDLEQLRWCEVSEVWPQG